MQYALISYVAAVDPSGSGMAVINVNGCSKNTQIDIPFGAVQFDPVWNSVVDPVVVSVQTNMNPASPSYDPSLL